MDEQPLQQAIMDAINSVMSPKEQIIQEIAETALLQFRPQGEKSLEEIKNRIEELNAEFEMLFEQTDTGEELEQRFAEINRELAMLKVQREKIAAKLRNNQDAQSKVRIMTDAAMQMEHRLTQWDEEMIRQLVHTVKVVAKDCIRVYLTDGTEIQQTIAEK